MGLSRSPNRHSTAKLNNYGWWRCVGEGDVVMVESAGEGDVVMVEVCW